MHTKTDLPLLPLTGDFQYNHAAAALSALHCLDPNLLNDNKNLFMGLVNTHLILNVI